MVTSLQVAAYTHVGLYRRRNEDSVMVGSRVFGNVSMDMPWTRVIDEKEFPVLLAVADGIGGSVAGDIASRSLLEYLSLHSVDEFDHDLKALLISGKEYLDSIALKNPHLAGLGTTLTGVLCNPEVFLFFSCGDSRAYIRRAGGRYLAQITKDHSVIQEMIDAGTLQEEEARHHPMGHIITSSFSGGRHNHQPDIRMWQIPANDGDRIVICTDGVWDYGGEQFLRACTYDEPENAVERVRDICMDAGAPDNISIIIADCPNNQIKSE